MAERFELKSKKHRIFSEQIISEAFQLLTPLNKRPLGDVTETILWSGFRVSKLLCGFLESELEKDPHWLKAEPILLGSWARFELCLNSDLDVLFLGPEQDVLRFVQSCLEKGIKLRSRIPANLEDWTENVNSPDIIALFQARALTAHGREQLEKQKEKIFNDKDICKTLLKDILADRSQRAIRYDSISNFLEPNIKYGPGGLRDLQQGAFFRELYQNKFKNSDYEKKVLSYYLGFFQSLRHYLHFHGGGDALMGSDQHSAYSFFGFESHREFMRQIERGISRVSFYSDWVLEVSKSSSRRLNELEKIKLDKPEKLLAALEKDQSVLSQYQVRRKLDSVFETTPKIKDLVKGRLLKKTLDVNTKDSVIHAVFRSRLIDKICPKFTRLVGHVQHDQYHRFTADAHILQACREIKRLYKKKSELTHLKKITETLSIQDWQILSWSALYHDLAKGIDSSDHSEVGEKWVKEDLKKFGLTPKMITEVAWIVKNHLELSIAAFRKNPAAKQTWQELFALGLNEKRLLRLAVFTAADIRATNPEAWNSWKAKLLSQLVQTLLQGSTQNFLQTIDKLAKKIDGNKLESLDPILFENFNSKILTDDLSKISRDKAANIKVFTDKNKRMWVRFYEPTDRRGILFEFVKKLFQNGYPCQHALIHTLPDLGVYDWFQIQSQSSPSQIEKRLAISQTSGATKIDKPRFDDISIISENDVEWMISFKAIDQRGLLLSAVEALLTEGAQVISARVHTWGRQVDDLFAIKPLTMSRDTFLEKLKTRLII